MNSQKLALLVRDDRAAQIFFAAYATRRRSLRETAQQEVMDLARRADIGLSPADVIAFFRALEGAQCGQMSGASPNARFDWLVKSTLAAKTALETAIEPDALDAPIAQLPTTTHNLRLRADWTLCLELPTDFTPAEAHRLCHFVSALPLSPPPTAPPATSATSEAVSLDS